jgi:hypothetical protein
MLAWYTMQPATAVLLYTIIAMHGVLVVTHPCIVQYAANRFCLFAGVWSDAYCGCDFWRVPSLYDRASVIGMATASGNDQTVVICCQSHHVLHAEFACIAAWR